MSQQKVLDIIKKLGGRATSAQIIAQARIDFPDSSLWEYVGTRLTKMYEWGDLDFKDEMVNGEKKRVWFIVENGESEIVKKRTVDDKIPDGIIFACCGRHFGSFKGLQQHRNRAH